MKIKLLLIFLLMQSVTYANTSMSDLFNKYSNISVNSDSGEASSENSENIIKTTNRKTSSLSDDFRKGQADAYAKGYSDAMSDCSHYGVKTKLILKEKIDSNKTYNEDVVGFAKAQSDAYALGYSDATCK